MPRFVRAVTRAPRMETTFASSIANANAMLAATCPAPCRLALIALGPGESPGRQPIACGDAVRSLRKGCGTW